MLLEAKQNYYSVLKVHIQSNKILVYSFLILVRIIRHLLTPTNDFGFGRHYYFLLLLSE